MRLTGSEQAQAIRLIAMLYLEVEAGRRPARTLTPHATSALALRLHNIMPRPIAGPLRTGQMACSATGDTLRAAVTVYRDDQAGALALTFRHTGTGWRLAEVEAPDRALLAGG
jgi:hypothetical protein